jgi:Bacterial Ig domain
MRSRGQWNVLFGLLPLISELAGCGGGGHSPPPPPVAQAQSLSVKEGELLSGMLVASAPDGQTLTFSVLTAPMHGTLALQPGNIFQYQPLAHYFGVDSFTYRVIEPSGGTASAVVSITVEPVYQQPTALDDLVAVPAGNPVAVDVLANDLNPDGNPLTVSIVTAPTVGVATVLANGNVQLALPAGFRGYTRFGYQIINGGGMHSMASAGVFVGAAPVQAAWVGDDFTSGLQDIVVHNLLVPRRINGPLAATESMGNVIFRTDGAAPEVGYTVFNGGSGSPEATFAARLDGSTPPVMLANMQISALSSDGRWAFQSQYQAPLQLAATDGSTTTAITAGPVCEGAFAGLRDNFVLECSQAGPTFAAPTYFGSSTLTPTTYTQLTQSASTPSPPAVPTMSPDGTTLLYVDVRTDTLGTYRGLFALNLSTTPATETLISPRLPASNATIFVLGFSADSRQLLYETFGATCALYSVALTGAQVPVQISPANLQSGSCPTPAAYSPDGSKVVFTEPAQSNGLGGDGIYEVVLANPTVVNQLAAPVAGVAYITVAYDEAGNDLFVTSNRSGANRNDIFEWHRGTANPFVQLSPPNLLPQAFAVSRDGAMIIMMSTDVSTAPKVKAYLINRAVPGQAWLLSNGDSALGISTVPGSYSLIFAP